MPSEVFTSIARTLVPRPVRNWLRSPSTSVEWLWDSATFAMGTTKTLQLKPDWSIVCHPRAYKTFYRDQVIDPEQSEEFRSFVSYCEGGMILFDIGAHFGIFSLAAAHFGGTAVAVDPSPSALRMLRKLASLNGGENQIQVLQAAVSDKEGEIELLSTGVFSNGYFQVAQGHPKSDMTQIPAVTIDQMVKRFGAPTHIKIDVEGHEAAVLRGSASSLREISPILFVELHNEMVISNGGDPGSALDELARLDYETFAIHGERIERNAILATPMMRIIARRKGAARN